MKLDRNGETGGKYAVLNMRKVREIIASEFSLNCPVKNAIYALEQAGLINYGEPESESEFFVLMLKDCHSDAGLKAYAFAARNTDPEYSDDVLHLARRAGMNSKFCKTPD